jgi:2-keto-4-pentenoate hydratase/2-oxohepta-3-ene-1,7-dioic acid hydratase in catechol pathway
MADGFSNNLMKIIRFIDETGTVRFGVPSTSNKATLLRESPYSSLELSDREATIKKLLAPVVPSSLLCIGLNYRHHAAESGAKPPERPILFMKTPNSVQNPGDPIEIPTAMASHKVDYECELAVVIGKPCKNATTETALSYVLGYTCANDVSARDWQLEWGGGQWCRGKSFDTFSPLGPCLVTTDEIRNPNALGIKTVLNGETVQNWKTNDMIFDVPALIAFLSGSNTLLPGTVILTGTPHGVGLAAKPPRWLKPGDTVVVEIEGIGQLINPVMMESA